MEAPQRKKIKLRGFALTAVLSNESPPTNSIWAHLKKMGSSALPIGGAAVDTGYASHRLFKTLKTFFRWCVGRAVIDFSPAEGISSPYRDVSRDRVLTDPELAAVILAARRMSQPYGLIVEFLALTGQRREEVAQLTQMGRAR